MQKKWKLHAFAASLREGYEAGMGVTAKAVWTSKGDDGKTDWEKLEDLASQGWELVSVTPLGAAHTMELLYTFKMPVEE